MSHRPSAALRHLVSAAFLLVVACPGGGEQASTVDAGAGGDAAVDGAAAPQRSSSPIDLSTPASAEVPERSVPDVPRHGAGAMVSVPTGEVLAGSAPGTGGRLPEHEMDGQAVELSAFEIDARPYPNDPSKAPLLGVSRQRAAELCEAAGGKRLCHELEWERACEGDDGRAYPFGDRFEAARYADPSRLSTPLGALAMGTIGEWTSSPWSEPIDGRSGGATVRGPGPAEGDAATRRCSRRGGLLPTAEEPWVGFRCCRGPEQQDVTYVTAEPVYPFDRIEELGTRERFQEMIRSAPELERVHDDPQPFTRDDVHNLMHEAGRSGPNAVPGFWYTWLPVRWIPRQGEEIIVAAGADGEDTFVAAFFMMPGGGFRHAASLIFVDTTAAVTLSYTRDRRYVHWLPCLDCRDGGLFSYEDGAVRISQRW